MAYGAVGDGESTVFVRDLDSGELLGSRVVPRVAVIDGLDERQLVLRTETGTSLWDVASDGSLTSPTPAPAWPTYVAGVALRRPQAAGPGRRPVAPARGGGDRLPAFLRRRVRAELVKHPHADRRRGTHHPRPRPPRRRVRLLGLRHRRVGAARRALRLPGDGLRLRAWPTTPSAASSTPSYATTSSCLTSWASLRSMTPPPSSCSDSSSPHTSVARRPRIALALRVLGAGSYPNTPPRSACSTDSCTTATPSSPTATPTA